MLPVASPKLLYGRTLTGVDDLREFTLLHAVPRLNDWAQWFALMGAEDIDAYRGMRFDTRALPTRPRSTSWAWRWRKRRTSPKTSKKAAWLPVFSTPLETERAFYALFAPSKRDDPGVLAFTQWLRHDLARFGATAAHSSI